MTKHTYTAGPWEVHKYASTTGGHGFTVRSKEHKGISIANLTPGISTDRIEPVAEANAYLIASAPDLLEAAKRALIVLEGLCSIRKPGDALGQLADAIAKAEPVS
jgi:hypothetical protein